MVRTKAALPSAQSVFTGRKSQTIRVMYEALAQWQRRQSDKKVS
jgi:hypothetical protein